MTVYVIPSFDDADFGDSANQLFGSLADPALWAAIGIQQT